MRVQRLVLFYSKNILRYNKFESCVPCVIQVLLRLYNIVLFIDKKMTSRSAWQISQKWLFAKSQITCLII